jgi:glycosyltransferase involved in cell wall biosynthesis
MPSNIRLSVILPVKNGQRHLQAALQSVQINCMPHDELIVIDDGSTDDTANLLHAFKPQLSVTVLQGRGQGPSYARNDGLKLARGSYITFLDHDDYWPADRVQSHLGVLSNDPNTFVVTGKTQYVSDLPDDIRPEFFRDWPAIFHVHLGASTFRRTVFEEVGFFDETLRFSEDHDLFLRIREAGLRIYPWNNVSLYYRIHETNMTLNKQLSELQLFQVIQKSLARRRLNGSRNLSPFPKNTPLTGEGT